jgi:glycosyltransferase involved in cell wall biosynthesis
MRKRILFLEALPVIAGGQQVLLDMLPALDNYDLHALLPGSGPLADELAASGVTCHFAPMANYTLVRKSRADVARFPFDQLRLAFRCAHLARRLHADLLYANSSRVFVWSTLGALLARLPVLWHAHNLLVDRKTLLLLRRLGRWRTVCRIVAVSRVAAEQFPALEGKMVVIPTGVDTTLFYPDPAARASVRAGFGIPLDEPLVGIVGDLIPLKGQHTLLEAARMLSSLGSSKVRYLVIGGARPGDEESHAYAARLRAMAGDNVVFTGRLEDLPAVLNAVDLLVIASERETGPLALLYALACGVPVVSTPVGRAPELIRPGVTGDLFPAGDAALLAERLSALLDDSHHLRRMDQAARKLAEEQLSLTMFRTRMRDTIKRTLEPSL